MAKVFMSFLGVNKYKEVCYEFGGKRSNPTPFVQEALIDFLENQISETIKFDKVIVFLTDAARKKNWINNGNFEKGLKTRLKNLNLKEVIDVSVPEGKTETEIIDIFHKICKSIEEGDEIYFDITHSFRSLPMLSLVALVYTGTLKKSQINGIYYGAFDALENVSKGEEIPQKERIAPIFDLTPYSRILQWSFAVEEFVRYGVAGRLRDLSMDKVGPILKETKGQDKEASSLKKFFNQLFALTQHIYTCRGPKIIERSVDIGLVKDVELLPEFIPLVDMVKQKVSSFSSEEDEWEKGLAAAKWCVEHNLIQQGYTILQEMIITCFLRFTEFEESCRDCRDAREFVSQFLKYAYIKPPEQWEYQLKKHKDLAVSLKRKFGDSLKELTKIYDKLTQNRNDINHCGFTKNRKAWENLMKDLKTLVEKAEKIMKEVLKKHQQYREVS